MYKNTQAILSSVFCTRFASICKFFFSVEQMLFEFSYDKNWLNPNASPPKIDYFDRMFLNKLLKRYQIDICLTFLMLGIHLIKLMNNNSLGVEQKYLFVYKIQTIFIFHKRKNNIFRSKQPTTCRVVRIFFIQTQLVLYWYVSHKGILYDE